MARQLNFFESYFEAVEELEPEVYKECLNTLFAYVFRGKEPEELSPQAKMFWTLVRPTVEKSLSKSANGKKGGEANRKQTESKPEANEKQTGSKLEPEKEKEKEKEKDKELKEKKAASRPVFRKPTVEEVAEYCRSRSNAVNPEQFVSWYDSNGWKVGKNPMKDWKAAVRTWEQRETARSGTTNRTAFNRIESHNYDFGELEKALGV